VSRIGNKPVQIPAGVEVAVNGNNVVVKGPKGQLELDVFDAPYKGLYLAEVEFPDEASANAFVPPVWFGKDVTYSSDYHNSTLSKGKKL